MSHSWSQQGFKSSFTLSNQFNQGEAAIHVATLRNELTGCDVEELERILTCIEEDNLVESSRFK